MESIDFNITFCTGGATNETIPECAKRFECKRWWTEECTKQAKEQGLIEHKILIPVDPNFITKEGCEYFLNKDE